MAAEQGGEGDAGIHERLRRLLEVQAQDRMVDLIAQRLDDLEAGSETAALAGASERALQRVEEKKDELQATRFQAHRQEKEADNLAGERRALEAKLYSGEIRNLKEMEQMDKKIQALREQAGELEEQALAAMDKSESLAEEIAELERDAATAQGRVSAAERRARQAVSLCRDELLDARARRDELAARADPRLLETYRALRAKQGGVAIAEVQGGACGACRVSLSVILANRIKRGEEVCRCENCGRILCWTGA